jgi:Family of unknown function (DUF6494)
MDEETFNLSLRKFLKTVGVNSQREIEHAVAKAIDTGQLKGNEAFAVKMRLTDEKLGLDVTFDGEIRLE